MNSNPNSPISNPHLPGLSDREIYAMSHPDSPDFESEAYAKSWCENFGKPKRLSARPVMNPFGQGFVDMHEPFNDAALNIKDWNNFQDFVEDHK